MKKSLRQHLGNLLKIGISVGLLAWVLPRIGLADIWREIQSVQLNWLGLAFGLCILGTASLSCWGNDSIVCTVSDETTPNRIWVTALRDDIVPGIRQAQATSTAP